MRNKYFISIAIVVMMVSVAFSDYPSCQNRLYPVAGGPHRICKCLSKLDVKCSDVLCDSVCADDYGEKLIDVYCYNSSTCALQPSALESATISSAKFGIISLSSPNSVSLSTKKSSTRTFFDLTLP
ncbi:hypothetical protein ACET3Z_031856 [Daucus carota]